MIAKMTDLQKVSLDTYRGVVTNYSTSEGNDAIRNAILEAVGGEWSYNKFMKNQYDVYEILIETLSIGMGTLLLDQLNNFVEMKDTNLGDTTTFIVEDNSLFKVASICDGNTDIRRQKLHSRKFPITTERLGLKVYADLEMFMANRIDWTKMINRVSVSFNAEIGSRIYNALYASYAGLNAPYAVTGVFTSEALADMVAHVEAQTGQTVVIYGTKKALGKITNANLSDKMKDELHLVGHFGSFQGTELLELPQAHKANTDTFVVTDDFLLVVPNGEKIVKVVLEGEPTMYETSAGARNDEQMEFFFARKVGIAVLKASQYGFYKIS